MVELIIFFSERVGMSNKSVFIVHVQNYSFPLENSFDVIKETFYYSALLKTSMTIIRSTCNTRVTLMKTNIRGIQSAEKIKMIHSMNINIHVDDITMMMIQYSK